MPDVFFQHHLQGVIDGAFPADRLDRTAHHFADSRLLGIAFTAAYCLIALAAITRWNVWMPGILPLGAVWLAILLTLIFRRREDEVREPAMAIPPPIA
jgi:hypothetical protein